MRILQNEKHMGDSILQKTFTADYLTKKIVKNVGQYEQYYIKDDHDPIVDKNLWEVVQLEIERRREYLKQHGLKNMGRYTDTQPFTNKVFCGVCGSAFRRVTITRENGKKKKKVWMCKMRHHQRENEKLCSNIAISEQTLHSAYISAWNALIENRDELMPVWTEQANSGDKLAAFRAEQFIRLTDGAEPLKEINFSLVNKTLESCTVMDNGVIGFRFLDGTEFEVKIEK